jgi:putative addiction module component (TIGR02574 family)
MGRLVMSFDDLLSEASQLAPADRILLSDLLRDSVEPDAWPPLSDEWLAEIDRRSTLYDQGQMSAAPWSEVRERTRKQVGLDG